MWREPGTTQQAHIPDDNNEPEPDDNNEQDGSNEPFEPNVQWVGDGDTEPNAPHCVLA